ncbi:hypothetical protein [Pseudomonas sp. PS02288]|uniref:hypothetical protein n=1 Tax=Pseudomonas sp. PS02288 TaxID=2991443 RepID=UPI00249C66FE|nr:hypothetical protein [Pseudomonas sp. PS02288]
MIPIQRADRCAHSAFAACGVGAAWIGPFLFDDAILPVNLTEAVLSARNSPASFTIFTFIEAVFEARRTLLDQFPTTSVLLK